MLGRLFDFLLGGSLWGNLAAGGLGLAVLVGAWQWDKVAYGDRRVAVEKLKNRQAKDANVRKARRVRDRVHSSDPGGLQPSPYVRRR